MNQIEEDCGETNCKKWILDSISCKGRKRSMACTPEEHPLLQNQRFSQQKIETMREALSFVQEVPARLRQKKAEFLFSKDSSCSYSNQQLKGLGGLNSDTLVSIWSFLSVEEIVTSSLLSARICHISRSDPLWQLKLKDPEFQLKNHGLSIDEFHGFKKQNNELSCYQMFVFHHFSGLSNGPLISAHNLVYFPPVSKKKVTVEGRQITTLRTRVVKSVHVLRVPDDVYTSTVKSNDSVPRISDDINVITPTQHFINYLPHVVELKYIYTHNIKASSNSKIRHSIRTRSFCWQLLKGIIALKGAGLYHSNISSSNVIINKEDYDNNRIPLLRIAGIEYIVPIDEKSDSCTHFEEDLDRLLQIQNEFDDPMHNFGERRIRRFRRCRQRSNQPVNLLKKKMLFEYLMMCFEMQLNREFSAVETNGVNFMGLFFTHKDKLDSSGFRNFIEYGIHISNMKSISLEGLLNHPFFFKNGLSYGFELSLYPRHNLELQRSRLQNIRFNGVNSSRSLLYCLEYEFNIGEHFRQNSPYCDKTNPRSQILNLRRIDNFLMPSSELGRIVSELMNGDLFLHIVKYQGIQAPLNSPFSWFQRMTEHQCSNLKWLDLSLLQRNESLPSSSALFEILSRFNRLESLVLPQVMLRHANLEIFVTAMVKTKQSLTKCTKNCNEKIQFCFLPNLKFVSFQCLEELKRIKMAYEAQLEIVDGALLREISG